MTRNSIAMVSHVWTPDIQIIYERLQREAPSDHDVRLLLNTDTLPLVKESGGQNIEHIQVKDLFRLPYPKKRHAENWDIAGNIDMAFLEFRRRLPDYDFYWFVEYDVHYEGKWDRLFEHFRTSTAAVIATTLEYLSKTPSKHNVLTNYPRLILPGRSVWHDDMLVKGFFPICRLSSDLFNLLHQQYCAGLGGHYEVTIPTLAVLNGLIVEDVGGTGSFVRDENRDRFYFANGKTYTHSPGNFVFRPEIATVLPRQNTLWHPVKPANVPLWHPLRARGNLLKNVKELIKLVVGRAWIRWWFATRWRPLP